MQNQSESLIVESEEAGERLDRLLANRFSGHFSRTYFQELIAQNLVSVNGESVKKREKLKAGDEIELFFTPLPGSSLEPEEIPLNLLYEDEEIAVINKPAGLVVHPAPGNWSGTLVNALLFHALTPKGEDSLRPGIVHRLDKETSGVIVTAKRAESQRRLVEQFQRREVKKQYALIAFGSLKALFIDAPIGRDERDRKKMALTPNGKPAETQFEKMGEKEGLLALFAYPKTGRTHQIRLHARALGAPILGDTLYGKEEKGVKRQMLHAYRIGFTHPMSGKWMEIEAPFPEDFSKIWSTLL